MFRATDEHMMHLHHQNKHLQLQTEPDLIRKTRNLRSDRRNPITHCDLNFSTHFAFMKIRLSRSVSHSLWRSLDQSNLQPSTEWIGSFYSHTLINSPFSLSRVSSSRRMSLGHANTYVPHADMQSPLSRSLPQCSSRSLYLCSPCAGSGSGI